MENALYFPFISVPNNPWFTRTLLYWDKVGSIIPFEFVESPERLSTYTTELLSNDLLFQLHPGQYVGRARKFSSAFIDYLNSQPSAEMESRRTAYNMGRRMRVHTEKMSDVGEYLASIGQAKRVNWSWYDVEILTANEFMAYLAAVLGQIPQVHCAPVTDLPMNIQPFIDASSPVRHVEGMVAPLRKIVLEKLLPGPVDHVPVDKLIAFKNKQGARLRRFRANIESEIAQIAAIDDALLRDHRLHTFVSSSGAEVDDIIAEMSSSRLGRINSSSLFAICASAAANVVAGLASAVWSAIARPPHQEINPAMLYAAYVERELMPRK